MTDTTYTTESAIAALSGVSPEAPEADIEDDAPESDDTELAEAPESQGAEDEDEIDPEEDPDFDEDEEGDEPDEPAIEAPQFLDEKERAEFAALPRAQQEMLLKHDKALVADYTRKTQALAEDRKAVQAQRQQLETVVETLGEVQTAAEREAAEWQAVDWVSLAQRVTAEEYNQCKAEAEASIGNLQQIRQQKARAEAASFQTHVTEQGKLLTEIAATQAPELLQPDAPEKIHKPMAEYLGKLGYSQDEIRWIGANDMVVAYKAMKYDQMIARRQGKATPALTPKPDAKATGKPVRPGARASSSNRAVNRDVVKQFKKTGSSALAMSLLKDID